MSGWTLATWAAVAVLIGGSLAVFAWFLADLRAFLGRRRRREEPPPEG